MGGERGGEGRVLVHGELGLWRGRGLRRARRRRLSAPVPGHGGRTRRRDLYELSEVGAVGGGGGGGAGHGRGNSSIRVGGDETTPKVRLLFQKCG